MSKSNENKLVPRFRFPEFNKEGEWNYENGDELFEPIVNKNHNSDLPILAITQEQGAIPRDMIDYHVSVTDKSVESYKVVEVGDFIISLRSFQGGIEYSQYRGLCSPAYIILRKKTTLENDFYRHYFKSRPFIRDLNKNLEGIRDGKMISYKQFSEILIPKPKPKEQQKIAACLSSLDDVITAESQKLEVLKDHKKGLLQNLLPTEGETVPKFRFKEFEDSGEWVEKKLGEICDVRDGTHDSPKYVSIGYPMITSKNLLNNGMIDFENVTFIKEEDYVKINKRSKVDINDILFGMIGTIGNPVIVKSDGFAIKNVALIKSNDKLNQEFLLHQLKSNYILDQFGKVNAGGILKFIALGIIRNLSVIVPSVQEQQKIAETLSSVDDLIISQNQKLEGLQLHKKGLLQGLFPSVVETPWMASL